MEVKSVNRKRPNQNPQSTKSNPREFSVIYKVKFDGTDTQVCKQCFLSIFAVTSKRCFRLSRLLQQNITPTDKRGQNTSGNAIPGDTIVKIRDHIDSYPVKKSHYTGKEMKYLAPNLNVKILYNMFSKKNPKCKISYKFFWEYFTQNYNLHFGRPAKDACIVCEELNNKVKSSVLADNVKRVAVGELLLHKRRAKKFYTSLAERKKECEDDINNKTAAICIDFMANVSLPCIPVQDVYYLRQLTVNTLGIHDLKTKRMTCFIYHEGVGGKGPNEVCSLLKFYIDNNIENCVDTLYIYADNCGGQNKNHSIIRLLMALNELKRFKSIILQFPLRGHSFMPNDRDFGLIRRRLNREERFYTLDDYVKLVHEASKDNSKFSVVKVETNELFLNYKVWWKEFYKRTCLSTDCYGKKVPKEKKTTFMISTYHEFIFQSDKPKLVRCSRQIGGFVNDEFSLRNTVQGLVLPTQRAYTEKLPINCKKMNDIKKVLRYVPDDKMVFWEEISNWSVTNDSDDE